MSIVGCLQVDSDSLTSGGALELVAPEEWNKKGDRYSVPPCLRRTQSSRMHAKSIAYLDPESLAFDHAISPRFTKPDER